MRVDEFLSSDAFTIVNKKLAKCVGIGQTILLQELICQRKRFGGNEFYFTQKNMKEELGISPNTQGKYLKELKEKGLIDFKKKGIPAKNYYIINDDKIINLLSKVETSSTKMVAPVPPKSKDIIINKNNNLILSELDTQSKDCVSKDSENNSNASFIGEGNTNNNILSANDKLEESCSTDFEKIRENIPAGSRGGDIEKGKKEYIKKIKQGFDANEILKSAALAKYELRENGNTNYRYVPKKENWLKDLCHNNEDEIELRITQILKNRYERMKQGVQFKTNTVAELCEIFGKEYIGGLWKQIQKEDKQ